MFFFPFLKQAVVPFTEELKKMIGGLGRSNDPVLDDGDFMTQISDNSEFLENYKNYKV